jgi:hypothetical protein
VLAETRTAIHGPTFHDSDFVGCLTIAVFSNGTAW